MPDPLHTPCLHGDGRDVLISVRVAPRAGRTAIAGQRSGRLLIQTTAPPVDGRANEAVCRLLAKTLRIARGRVNVAGGERARDKLVRVEHVTAAEAITKLGLAEAHDDTARA